MNTYTKLKDGSWGIRAKSALSAGGSVVLTKKDGTTKNEVVGAAVASFDGVFLYKIAASSAPVTRAGPRRSGGLVGYERGVGRVCSECGDSGARVAPGTRCWETGMSH